ncbi:5-methyltetrahydropteroyltriglutamate-homocysteine methyltransferase [Tothia fuscella]|uniref:5-methyltetrahydropteroyltriglutamate-homocysteine methyltransferase n=1 Tax=Tothia fuscella TaxID=1048955 RepID=A0A9P4TUC3_9PEZI|nr:5-methyltetrahydropteroyltriglutamate-homocysteine methyltransferase [Tothia fuscella]
MAPPFSADHIGSFLRPQKLLDAQAKHSSGSVFIKGAKGVFDSSMLKVAEREAIAWVVKQQISRNIRPITSGEFERQLFSDGFIENLKGFQVVELSMEHGGPFRTNYPANTYLLTAGMKKRAAAIATDKIMNVTSPLVRDWKYLTSVLPNISLQRECKVTMPSPTWQHFQLKQAWVDGVYDNDETFFEDVAVAYRKELKTLWENGVRNVQIDDPHFTFFCDEQMLEGLKVDGVDADELLDLYIDVHNRCLEGRPSGMHLGVHLCRGNFTGSVYFCEGGYERVAEKIFRRLDYDTDKNVVLGVVSTKTVKMEDLDALKGRVLEACDVMAKAQGRLRSQVLANVGVSPQCGFSSASSGGGIAVTMDIMWKKMELVKDLAHELRLIKDKCNGGKSRSLSMEKRIVSML